MMTHSAHPQRTCTPAAELPPALRSRLLCAMLQQQQEVLDEGRLKRQLSTVFPPENLDSHLLESLKTSMRRESRRLSSNRCSRAVWHRRLLPIGAALVMLIVGAVTVCLSHMVSPELIPVAQTAQSPVELRAPRLHSAGALATVHHRYSLSTPRDCFCVHGMNCCKCRQAGCGSENEDSLRNKSEDDSELPIRILDFLNINMEEDSI